MKGLAVFLVSLFILSLATSTANAITNNDWFSINNDSIYYDSTQKDTCGSSGSSGQATLTGNETRSAWTQNPQPPYYLEEYVISVLQDIAQTLNVPTTSTVTQQHVLAMIAWGYEEGGNIENNSSFNVWNTGINIPALLSTANSTSGVQSFISYDAGVEGNTITMTTSNQSRIGTLLSDPNSSASQVLTAIATPSAYSGNQGWATDPNYLSKLLAMLPQTQNDYSQMASVEIGPNQENQNHVPVSELQFAGGTGSASIGTTTASCISGGSGGNCQSGTKSAILCAAQQYTGIYYTLGGGHDPYTSFRKGCPISSISSAASSSTAANPGPCSTDCSGLVSVSLNQAFNNTTYLMSVDSSSGFMEGNGAQFWKEIPISQATAGDIVTRPDHVEIVDHVSGSTVYTDGSHFPGPGGQTGPTSPGMGYYTMAFTWTGPTS